jgi:hypothetical protein
VDSLDGSRIVATEKGGWRTGDESIRTENNRTKSQVLDVKQSKSHEYEMKPDIINFMNAREARAKSSPEPIVSSLRLLVYSDVDGAKK